jgi:hypothetical protein
MKKLILSLLFSVPLTLTLFAQTAATPSVSPQPTALSTPAATSSPADDEDALERSVKRNFKKHFNINLGRHHGRGDSNDVDVDSSEMAIPIVGIVFTTIFGTPVFIVAAIMFFSYLRSRSLHRTVRTMVEKGQPVPAALFAPPPVIRARSDMRRGVVLSMIGIGLMLFFGAVNDWEGGAWALGLIPFLIGVGYLIVWKLEGGKNSPPPLP